MDENTPDCDEKRWANPRVGEARTREDRSGYRRGGEPVFVYGDVEVFVGGGSWRSRQKVNNGGQKFVGHRELKRRDNKRSGKWSGEGVLEGQT